MVSMETRNMAFPALQKVQAPIAFMGIALAFLVVQQFLQIDRFYYDSALYWDQGHPSRFLGTTVRGYVFPLFLHGLRHITDATADPVFAYGILASLIYAYVLAVLLPRWFVGIFGGDVSLGRRLVPGVLLAVMFPGLVFYPLSDLPALLLAFGSLYCVYRVASSPELRRWRLPALLAILAGALAMAACNVRPIYVFMLPGLLLLVFFLFKGRRVSFLALTLVGMALAGLPQSVINAKANGTFSPLVTHPVGKNSLFAAQLVMGITVQRYETSYVSGSLSYIDPAGMRLVRKVGDSAPIFTFAEYQHGMADRVVSVADYVRLAAQFPLDFLGIYVRHVVSGLDARDGEVYVAQSTADRNFKSLIGFGLLATAVLTLLSRRLPSRAPPPRPAVRFALAAAALLLLPVAAIVPGAVESRFFLPLHLLAYCVIAFLLRPGEFWAALAARPQWGVMTLLVGGLYLSIAQTSFGSG